MITVDLSDATMKYINGRYLSTNYKSSIFIYNERSGPDCRTLSVIDLMWSRMTHRSAEEFRVKYSMSFNLIATIRNITLTKWTPSYAIIHVHYSHTMNGITRTVKFWLYFIFYYIYGCSNRTCACLRSHHLARDLIVAHPCVCVCLMIILVMCCIFAHIVPHICAVCCLSTVLVYFVITDLFAFCFWPRLPRLCPPLSVRVRVCVLIVLV